MTNECTSAGYQLTFLLPFFHFFSPFTLFYVYYILFEFSPIFFFYDPHYNFLCKAVAMFEFRIRMTIIQSWSTNWMGKMAAGEGSKLKSNKIAKNFTLLLHQNLQIGTSFDCLWPHYANNWNNFRVLIEELLLRGKGQKNRKISVYQFIYLFSLQLRWRV